MTDEQLYCYELHLPRLRAEQTLWMAQTGQIKLNGKGWYQMTLAATGDEQKAQEAEYEYRHERTKRGLETE